MINKALIYIVLFLASTTLLFIGVSAYKSHKLKLSRSETEKLETKAEVMIKTHDVELIENNQSVTFTKGKEIVDEEVPSSIGTHTISLD